MKTWEIRNSIFHPKQYDTPNVYPCGEIRLTIGGLDNKILKKKELDNNMANKSFIEMTKEDAKSAAYRVAAKQMTKGTKTALVKMLEKNVDNNTIVAVKEIMDTEVGTAGVGMLLGLLLNYVPQLSQDPRMQKLAEEFRIEGMAVAGNAVIGAALENFMPVITEAMKALPALEEPHKIRITHKEEEHHHEEEKSPRVVALKSQK